MTLRRMAYAGAAIAASALHGHAQQATQPSSLPAGASAVNETYEDWKMLCGSHDGKAVCTVAQTQSRQNTGQRILDIRLNPADEDGVAQGLLTLPFGRALSKGATLQVDDGTPTEALPFSTCVPSGCLVPLALDDTLFAALGKGTKLNIAAARVDGQAVSLAISLKGFANALTRAAELSK